MSRLASILTALWLSSAAAHPGFFDDVSKGFNTVKKIASNEGQALGDPVGKTIAHFGGALCAGVKKITFVDYENYVGNEPDMSQLTLVYITKAKTVYYKLAEAATEIPKESWWNRKLVIYLHGFTDNPTKSSFQTMLTAFKSKDDGDVAILALDASSLIKFFYIRATTMVRFIGAYLGKFIVDLILAGLELKNVHLLGHSLGSHIAGFAGQTVQALTGGDRVGRITGMDPAGPCFAQLNETLRLSHDDADFVDVIHTDAGVYGLNEQIGHVDYWANRGNEQPGCLLQTCSHSRAWEIYAESVTNPSGFVGVQCDSENDFKLGQCNLNDTSVMGYATPHTTRGNYWFLTLDEEPYAAGVAGLTYKPNGLIRGLGFEVGKLFQGR